MEPYTSLHCVDRLFRRKKLVVAIAASLFVSITPVTRAASSFTFVAGDTIVSKSGSDNSTASDVKFIDLDGDGDNDIALPFSPFWSDRIYKNNGSGSFTQYDTIGTAYTQNLHIYDFNGDNRPDILIDVTNTTNRLQLWLNDGTGDFTFSTDLGITGSYGTQDAAVGDLNGDGDLDVFVVNGNGNGDQVYLGNGDGTFTNTGQSLGGGRRQY